MCLFLRRVVPAPRATIMLNANPSVPSQHVLFYGLGGARANQAVHLREGFDTTEVSTGASVPMLSDKGAVTFTLSRASVDLRPHRLVFLLSFRFENGSLKSISADDSGMTAVDGSPNGTLLIYQKIKGEPFRLFLDQGETRTQILSTADGDFSSIGCAAVNDGGDVVFGGIRDAGLGGYFLRTLEGKITTLVEELDLPDLSALTCSQFAKLRISKSATVISATGTEKWAFVMRDGKAEAVRYADPRYAGASFYVTEVAINSNDVMVFGGQLPALPGLPAGVLFRSGGGALAEMLLATTNRSLPSPRIVCINDREDVS
jgi:hypothetical protein